MKKKSLKFNMLLNMIRSLTSIIFPLISFPYVSKVLGVDSLGQYNFATSVITYILLFAALGIEYYAVREGAKIRDDKEKITKFASQIFSINVISTICAYIILGALIICIPKFFEYRVLLCILSAQVLFTTLGINWVYSIYEEYTYITIRSIIVQILSIIAMFVFIKTPNDVLAYAVITVIASAGANIFNFIFSRRYCKIKFVLSINWKKHLKPILILFGMAAAATIYANSDMVMLGFIKGEYSVGIYSFSMKIHNIIKTVLSAAVIVSIPRLSMLLGQKRNEEANTVAKSIYSTMLTLLVPCVVGLIVLSKELVYLLADQTFMPAIYSHIILCVTVFFSLGSYFWGQAVLVPSQKESWVFYVTVVSAVVNVILNLILIPIWGEIAAAITTLIAEIIGFTCNYWNGRKYVKVKDSVLLLLKVAAGCIFIVVTAVVLRLFISNIWIYISSTIIISVALYVIVEILLQNETVYDIYAMLKRKLKGGEA